MWKKRDDGGQFYNQADGKLCLVVQSFDNGTDEWGRPRPHVFVVLQVREDGGDVENPWFYDCELEEHTVVIDTQAGDLHGN